MTLRDDRDCAVSGATPAALRAYEAALATTLAWRSGAGQPLAAALQDAPAFVMAHVLRAYALVCTRQPERVRAGREIVQRAAALPADERERLHLATIAAIVGDDYERARARLAELLRRFPRDLLALNVAHFLDYITGDIEAMGRRVAAVLPAWSSSLPGHHAVMSMQAFALEEAGAFERAEETALAALAQDPLDARACHVMAHVFEMTDRPDAGIRWMAANAGRWSVDTVVATHGHWHVALFHLALGDIDAALDVYDRHVRATRSTDVADLIDASALLWRVGLSCGDMGGDAGGRWIELAAAWAPRVDDRFCSFSDLHAMLAFVGADDVVHAARLERALRESASRPTRHGETTRLLGLSACRALRAFGRGDDALALRLLAGLPPRAHRLGGSHAQRDVLTLTLRRAAERRRRSTRRAVALRSIVARGLAAGCAPLVAAGSARWASS